MPTLRQSFRRPGQPRRQGQAVVEFALAVIPFLILLMGVIDLGRGIYTMNGTSEAARDIARVTIVHLTSGGKNKIQAQNPDATQCIPLTTLINMHYRPN